MKTAHRSLLLLHLALFKLSGAFRSKDQEHLATDAQASDSDEPQHEKILEFQSAALKTIKEAFFQSHEMMNASNWEGCPTQCSECCKSDSFFGSGGKFKCILKKKSEFPEGRRCTGLSKRNSAPEQSKVDCELTEAEVATVPQELGQCSKKAVCCCPEVELPKYRPLQVPSPPRDQICVSQETAREWGSKKTIRHSNGLVEVVKLIGNPYDVDNISLCGFFDAPGKPKDQGERGARYYRAYGLRGQCKTDIKGLTMRGTEYTCPSGEVRSGNIFHCNCPYDCGS
jgi:hypothetical protein